mmetsp:Transcript_93694/g.264416  ORF Transcript_93694/g.264416 Transcript_93694/m.264416 type:complete len:353 (+) Transcript_93694:1314-2372(+)
MCAAAGRITSMPMRSPARFVSSTSKRSNTSFLSCGLLPTNAPADSAWCCCKAWAVRVVYSSFGPPFPYNAGLPRRSSDMARCFWKGMCIGGTPTALPCPESASMVRPPAVVVEVMSASCAVWSRTLPDVWPSVRAFGMRPIVRRFAPAMPGAPPVGPIAGVGGCPVGPRPCCCSCGCGGAEFGARIPAAPRFRSMVSRSSREQSSSTINWKSNMMSFTRMMQSPGRMRKASSRQFWFQRSTMPPLVAYLTHMPPSVATDTGRMSTPRREPWGLCSTTSNVNASVSRFVISRLSPIGKLWGGERFGANEVPEPKSSRTPPYESAIILEMLLFPTPPSPQAENPTCCACGPAAR